mmetsp:Transcript_33936/g.50663  ORF Transcript_33936/g.50663 Transcript_33936/m.50663 type:complete len:81 (+) Transcript_33936:952-1194(+)
MSSKCATISPSSNSSKLTKESIANIGAMSTIMSMFVDIVVDLIFHLLKLVAIRYVDSRTEMSVEIPLRYKTTSYLMFVSL